ncbi:KH domain containing protein [Pyrenophora tritici-repentis Pt-1C-BFP]|uniref:KH domain containing protein n=1 Tax=Pyrenophora tritici-repentis (strain Pt-1C-BFP) TaxID=426418 RepID=B2W475_PYRTR|nr:KH domain containing protein [Pyrenophora tritici-repentis Pt-1C-BFP]EDU48182.1 KH domain containing protein [Pyrenophora tritici-repentis Pt-1C-BFP]
MHKLSNFPAQARHGWEKMAPSTSFSFSRSNHEMPVSAPIKRPSTATTSAPPVIAPGTQVNLSFNVPFSSNLQGPDPDDIMWASPGAKARWTHAEGTAEGTPTHKLPVHAQNVDKLRNLCREVSEQTDGRVSAVVTSAESKPLPGLQRGPLRALVTNVCLSGELEIVNSMRCRILNSTPISLRSSFVDIDSQLIIDPPSQNVRGAVLNQLDLIAKATKADMFLLMPKQPDIETASFHGNMDTGMDPRLRCQIYGDLETMEHAKTRVLIMIDQILKRSVDTMKLELTMHTLICGRGRKNIKMIESATGTAIYFPPPFPRLFGYTPHGAQRRPDDLVYITGENPENILRAKQRLHDLVMSTKVFVKPVMVTDTKLDAILLERLDKVRKIIENNGSYILLPPLGVQRGLVRVQGTDVLHVERTVRELMQLAGQFYSASWFITHPDPTQRPPTPADVRAMLSDICINSGAEVSFEKLNFHIYGSDDAVRAALMVISNIPFVKKSQYNMSVKIELANEHKEFVSGKKNGKINKIMSHSSVQIVFDGFNEYNFYIVVRGAQYEATKNGLDLVEQEMPASISFHVPDQYHKRIIGIGGQHIQRIMKKYSVFVKFSNAMDRGGFGKEEDDIKVDNVICRTPARNAQNRRLGQARDHGYVMHGLDTNTVRGALPRPKSDSFEDSLPFFESKLLQRAEPAVESTDSPTRSHFGGDDEPRGMLDRLRKPGSMSSFTSIFNGRKSTNSPGSLFKHASSNASKASLASLESTGSYRNPWNDSGINLADDEHHTNGWPMPAPRFESKFPFGSSSAAAPGDVTPRYDARGSVDSGRPSTSHSASGYPAPIGPPR